MNYANQIKLGKNNKLLKPQHEQVDIWIRTNNLNPVERIWLRALVERTGSCCVAWNNVPICFYKTISICFLELTVVDDVPCYRSDVRFAVMTIRINWSVMNATRRLTFNGGISRPRSRACDVVWFASFMANHNRTLKLTFLVSLNSNQNKNVYSPLIRSFHFSYCG